MSDELGNPVTPERIEALLAHFQFRSDPEAWEVGLVVKALRARVADREHELIRVRAERDAALAALASIEWQPRRTLAGTEALFCPARGRPKSEPAHLRALNRKHGGIRDDGHRRDCPLALALEEAEARAAAIVEAADVMANVLAVVSELPTVTWVQATEAIAAYRAARTEQGDR